ncbi:MAG TPA: hypothetical protein PKW51_04145 [Methanoregulaceae archaeon]|nr:hypothetical protein [Methanoregulaceae archaeon]
MVTLEPFGPSPGREGIPGARIAGASVPIISRSAELDASYLVHHAPT